MASLITKGTTPLDKSNTGVVNFVKIESIDESSGNITITQKISLDEHNGYLHRSQLKENDILFSIAGTLGRVTSVKSSILPANTNQALAIIRLKDGCLDYVKTYLKGKAVADFIKKNPTIGAQPNLSLEQVANLEIIIPSEDEQKIIGAFFQQLDNLITLHQCKCQIDGCRFQSPLAITWEQRKVSELFKVTRGYVLAATLTEPAKTDEMPYPVYSSQTKDNGLMGYYKDYLYEDAITWTTDGANAGTVNYRAGKFYCTNVCGVLLSNEVTANQMIAEALNNVAKGYVSYVGNPKLMNNVMADIEIMIPTHAEEREKLSVFFRNLDNLITLHQCE